MNRCSALPDSKGEKPEGFTLIELMVVMLILGILIGIAVPTISKISQQARNKAALNTAHQLKTSISTYHTEYRKYPVRNPGGENVDSPFFSDHDLIDVLMPSEREAAPGGLNPRNQPYCSFKTAKSLGRGRYHDGIVLDNSGGGELWDPFGQYYRVLMDTNYDNKIPAPRFETGIVAVNQRVMVWSAGSDEDDAESQDNLVTWH